MSEFKSDLEQAAIAGVCCPTSAEKWAMRHGLGLEDVARFVEAWTDENPDWEENHVSDSWDTDSQVEIGVGKGEGNDEHDPALSDAWDTDAQVEDGSDDVIDPADNSHDVSTGDVSSTKDPFFKNM